MVVGLEFLVDTLIEMEGEFGIADLLDEVLQFALVQELLDVAQADEEGGGGGGRGQLEVAGGQGFEEGLAHALLEVVKIDFVVGLREGVLFVVVLEGLARGDHIVTPL